MTDITKTHCDGCEKDITEDSGMPELRLVVYCESIPVSGGGNVRLLVHVEPPFTGKKHFCSKKCLMQWLEDN